MSPINRNTRILISLITIAMITAALAMAYWLGRTHEREAKHPNPPTYES